MLAAHVVEIAQGLARKEPDLWVMTLFLKLVDHDDRNDHRLLFETKQSLWITEQNRGVEHIGSKGICLLYRRLGCILGFCLLARFGLD